MLPYLGEVFGNPSSIHHVGRRARSLLDDARDRLAVMLRSKPSELVFTSGGTESCNLAILGAARHLRPRGHHIITSRIEHHAVLHACEYLSRHEAFEVTYLPVSPDGFVSVESIESTLRPDTILVSIMAANNEIGSIQPVAEIGSLCRHRGVAFHTDAVQCFGKQRFLDIHQFNADLVSVCAHKFHGPKGAGMLYVRSPLQPDPILLGGGHENERRAGTENLAAIVGLVEAFQRFVIPSVFSTPTMASLAERLISSVLGLSSLGVTLRSPLQQRLVNTIAFTVAGCDSLSLLANLDLAGVCASSGSACSAGSLEPSHVMLALGVPQAEANSLVRFSLGRETTAAEIAFVEHLLPELIHQVQQSP
jgi:cysteine desulfurase